MYFRYDPFQENVVKEHIYYFYITTNSSKTVLYCGITNSLEHRIVEHYLARGIPKTFTGHSCYFLIYYEEYDYVEDAISREKEVKKWNRMKKERLIESMNPEKSFLNGELFDQ